MITKIQGYNEAGNINYKGTVNRNIIKMINDTKAKMMEEMVRTANANNEILGEDSYKSIARWASSLSRRIKEYMKGFNDDITLIFLLKDIHPWWQFKNKKNDISTFILCSTDKFGLEKDERGTIEWLMKNVTPDFVYSKMLHQLKRSAKLIAEAGDGTVASVKEALRKVKEFAHQIKDPSGYMKNFKPEVDTLRRERAAEIRAKNKHDKFDDINREIWKPYKAELEKLRQSYTLYPNYYIIDNAINETFDMVKSATEAFKRLHKRDLAAYVVRMQKNISDLDEYVKLFPDCIYIDRDMKHRNTPWVFKLRDHYSSHPIKTERAVTPKQKEKPYIDVITEDIEELKLNEPIDIVNELLDAGIERALKEAEKDYFSDLNSYRDSNGVLLSQINTLVQITGQKGKYEQFIQKLNEIMAPKEAKKKAQASNNALLNKYTKGKVPKN